MINGRLSSPPELPPLAFGTPLGPCVVVPLRGAPPPGRLSAAAWRQGRRPLLRLRVKEAPLSAHTRTVSGPGGERLEGISSHSARGVEGGTKHGG